MPNKKMVRPRSRKYRDLPDNLTYDATRGLYRYLHPITKKRQYLSNNKKTCVRAAKQLNARLTPASADLMGKVLGGGQTWTMAVYRYELDVMPDEKWGDKTRKQYVTYLRNLRACSLGAMAVSQIEVVQVVQSLDKLTTGKRMRNIYRHLMIKVFRYAVEMGWCAENPAEVTRVVNDKRQRMRLTMAGYQAVYAVADPWLQVAMDFALVSLQRPEDLVMARYSDVVDGCLRIRQRKTGTKLQIVVGSELSRVIEASRDNCVCPFIIHQRPRRIPKKQAAAREHPMQVFVDKLGKAFSAARDKSGYYAKAKQPPPTFYEIKSLGGDRYRQMGWPESQIQALYGHADRDMTAHYLEGHEPPWETVTAG